MADFNQFGSVKPGAPGDPQHCAQCEAMLVDALDGTLSVADQATFDTHMIGCPGCSALLADAQRGAAWMEMLKSPRPEPPAALFERILAQTSGKEALGAAKENKAPIVLGRTDYLRTPTPTTLLSYPAPVGTNLATNPFASAKVLPFRARVTSGLRSFGHTMLQPRLAMTAAMAFFSIALTMNLTGIRLSQIHASDLKPSSILRTCYETKAKVVRYSDNLRVVYELESRVRDLQRSSDEDGSSGAATPASQNNSTRKPAATQPDDPNTPKDQKPGGLQNNQKPDQKQNSPKPNPGSSRRETPSGGQIQMVASVRTQAPPPFASKAFAVLTPSVYKLEGGLV
ncbi:anti-sigma factor [Granulicella sp. S190]|uniref:anti-sigma factor family protein n=1 Tax=Granulicella sp. S190 TaxID=1747226 RepID=UPI00131B4E38|nr:zf-HC2 domain-containing protein [Granulicella sp. S190]